MQVKPLRLLIKKNSRAKNFGIGVDVGVGGLGGVNLKVSCSQICPFSSKWYRVGWANLRGRCWRGRKFGTQFMPTESATWSFLMPKRNEGRHHLWPTQLKSQSSPRTRRPGRRKRLTRAGQWVNINISPILLDIIAVSVALCSLGCQLPGSFDRLVGLIGCICSIVQCLVKMYLFSLWMFAFLLMSNVAMKVFSAASGQGIIVSEHKGKTKVWGHVVMI